MFHSSRQRREFEQALHLVVKVALSVHDDKALAEQFLLGEIRQQVETIHPTMPRAGDGEAIK